MSAVVEPLHLSAPAALKMIRELAADTERIVVIRYAQKRGIPRRQIERCVQKGNITEGPFRNAKGNWQVNLYRRAAGEELTCVVVIDWATKVLVINAFRPKESLRRQR